MKRIGLLIVLVMLSLTACKSPYQKAVDDYNKAVDDAVKEYGKAVDAYKDALKKSGY